MILIVLKSKVGASCWVLAQELKDESSQILTCACERIVSRVDVFTLSDPHLSGTCMNHAAR